MSAGQLYAAVTLLAGVILLLGWLYVTATNPRSSTILLKSFFLFVLPGTVLVALSPLFRFPLSLWVVVLIEELLKATAASTEQESMDKFLLVTMFGIWELIWVKPLWGLNHAAVLHDWSNLQLTGLTIAGFVTVLMHAVTAEIYAFRLVGRLWVALVVSWIIHTGFNEGITLLDVSLLSCLVLFVTLMILFTALWPKRTSAPQSSSSS